MSIEESHDTPKGQLDAEIDEALAGSGEVAPVGYWPAFPDEPGEPKKRKRTPKRAGKTSPGSSRKRKVAKKGVAKTKARSKAKARPLKKKTARKASSRKPRARSTKKRTTKKKSSKKSTAKKRKAARATRATDPQGGRPAGGDLLSRVRSAVRRMGAGGRFGNKVFISEIYEKVEPEMSMPEFKRWLVDQNRERALNLARADLVGAMDPGQVSKSEIVDMGSSFHFVIDPDYQYGYG